jgi:uncharacterized OsmC-like protein
MTMQNIAAAVQRLGAVLQRRPEFGLHDDAPAMTRWQGGARMMATHANGTELFTDLPKELGGSGELVTPGWLFRAGLATCAASSILLCAATEGIELTALEVRASSRTDVRGLLGMTSDTGELVGAGPIDLRLHVRICADAVSAERLRAVVAEGMRRSPIPNAVSNATPVALDIDVNVS